MADLPLQIPIRVWLLWVRASTGARWLGGFALFALLMLAAGAAFGE
jgi:hypothetical protein